MYSELKEDNLSSVLAENPETVVQFSAGWCGNCRMIKPKFKRMSTEKEDVNFVVVDAEKFPNSRQLAKVDNLPTFAYFRNGELVDQIQTNKADTLLNFVNETSTN